MNKTLYHIPVGKENAVLLKNLAMILGVSPRETKRRVQRLRDDGCVILSSSSGGYFIPSSDEDGLRDVKHYIKMMEAQAKSRFIRVKSAKRWMQEYQQLEFDLNK